jgi:hypothetical protein
VLRSTTKFVSTNLKLYFSKDDFWKYFHNFWKRFSFKSEIPLGLNCYAHPTQFPSFAPEQLTVGSLGPPVTHREDTAAFSPAVSSLVTEVTTIRLLATRRSRLHLTHGQMSSALSSPECMVARWHWRTMDNRSKPWWRPTRRAWAPRGEGDNGARDRRKRERAEETLTTRGHERRPWCHGRGDARLSLSPSANRGEGVSTRRRKARRSWAQDESSNGSAVEEHDTNGCCGDARWRRKPLSLLLLLLSEERKWEVAAEADARAEGVGGRGGTRGPPDG